MNTQEMILIATDHYSKNYSGGLESQMLYERYATEELEMDKEQAEEFAQKALDGDQAEAEPYDMLRFWAWYYTNVIIDAEVSELEFNEEGDNEAMTKKQLQDKLVKQKLQSKNKVAEGSKFRYYKSQLDRLNKSEYGYKIKLNSGDGSHTNWMSLNKESMQELTEWFDLNVSDEPLGDEYVPVSDIEFKRINSELAQANTNMYAENEKLRALLTLALQEPMRVFECAFAYTTSLKYPVSKEVQKKANWYKQFVGYTI